MPSSSTSRQIDLVSLIAPTPKQSQAFKATLLYQFLLYGGAMGGGKSYFLRWWCIRECLRLYAKYNVKGVRIGLFSKDYPTLRDRQISRMKFEVPETLGVISNSQTDGFNLVLHKHLGGGTVALRNLDDPSKYNSAEFAGVAIEELTENPEVIFHELRKRIRWPGIPIEDMHFVAAANPGGIGHAWVKKLWIDKDFPPELKEFASRFGYVKALAQDNPHLDPAYYEMLMSLPEEMRKAYAEGSWDIFAGQYFTEWRSDRHVSKPFAIPPWWKRWRSMDWGYTAAACCLWLARSPEGVTYVYRELYVRNRTVQELADAIVAAERRDPVEYGVLDAACWDDSRGLSIEQQFRANGVLFRKSGKDRIGRWQRLRKMLADGSIQVFDPCVNLIRTLPAMVYDKIRVEDLDSDGEDHAVDALGYGIEDRGPATDVPLSVTPEMDRIAWERMAASA